MKINKKLNHLIECIFFSKKDSYLSWYANLKIIPQKCNLLVDIFGILAMQSVACPTCNK